MDKKDNSHVKFFYGYTNKLMNLKNMHAITFCLWIMLTGETHASITNNLPVEIDSLNAYNMVNFNNFKANWEAHSPYWSPEVTRVSDTVHWWVTGVPICISTSKKN